MERDIGQKIVLSDKEKNRLSLSKDIPLLSPDAFPPPVSLEFVYPDPPLITKGVKQPPRNLKELAKHLMDKKEMEKLGKKAIKEKEEAIRKAGRLIKKAATGFGANRDYWSPWADERTFPRKDSFSIGAEVKHPTPLSKIINPTPIKMDWLEYFTKSIFCDEIKDLKIQLNNPELFGGDLLEIGSGEPLKIPSFSGLKLGSTPLTDFLGDPPESDEPNEYLSGKKDYEEVYGVLEKRGNGYLMSQKDIVKNWFTDPHNKIHYNEDKYLTAFWNSLPDDHPFKGYGTYKFFELWSVFHPQVLAISDINSKIPLSIFCSDIIINGRFKSKPIEVSPEKEEAIKEHSAYLLTNSEYKEKCDRDYKKCAKRLNDYIDGGERTIPQDIIEVFYTIVSNTGHDFHITKKTIRRHLMEHGDDRYKADRFLEQNPNKGAWANNFKRASEFIPLTRSLKGRGKARRKVEDPTIGKLENGEPTNASGSSKGVV